MNPTDPATDLARNGITRRNFMKKTALTAGAVMVLSRGVGFALEAGSESCEHTFDKNGGIERNGGSCKPFQKCSKCGKEELWGPSHNPPGSNNGWVPCACSGNDKFGKTCSWKKR